MGAGGTGGGTLVTTLAQGAGLVPTHPDSTWIRETDSPLILQIPPNTKLDHSEALGLSLQYSSHLGGHVCGTDTQPLKQGSNSASAGTARGTRCPRGLITFTVFAVARAGMEPQSGLRGSWTRCVGGTAANSPSRPAVGHSQPHAGGTSSLRGTVPQCLPGHGFLEIPACRLAPPQTFF